MTDPQDDIPCTACETEGSRSRLDDDGLCPGCRTPAGRLVTALAGRGVRDAAASDRWSIVVGVSRLAVEVCEDDSGFWTIAGFDADGITAADAIAAIVQAPGLREAIRAIATAIGTPADVDPLADLPGLVLAVQAVVQRAESAAIVVADAVAAERMAIGAYIRERAPMLDYLARAIEHGDHIDDDAPPLPSLRLTLAARRMLLEHLTAADDELKALRDRVRALEAERDRRIDPVEHARAVMEAWLTCFLGPALSDDFIWRQAVISWLSSPDRAALLARVGPDVLAEVER